jgi:glycosyltransferase involved in cell wall biosynthesis
MIRPVMVSLPALSVVINTFNKAATLERVIDALSRQEGMAPSDFEVIVRDDGSTDDTPRRLQALAARWDGRLTWSSGRNAGVSQARNEAVRRARGDLVLLLGDDIVASPALLRRHLEAHARQPDGRWVVVGRVTWPPELEANPFLHWLDNGGPQFAYSRIPAGGEIPPRYFYACNASLPRATLLAQPFDPDITYGFEDVELGHRLHRLGHRFLYDPEACGFHHHPRSFREFRARQFKVGQSLHAALRNHPDLSAAAPPPRFPTRRRLKLILRRLLYPAARAVGSRRLQAAYWRTSLDLALYRGFQEARRRDRSP